MVLNRTNLLLHSELNVPSEATAATAGVACHSSISPTCITPMRTKIYKIHLIQKSDVYSSAAGIMLETIKVSNRNAFLILTTEIVKLKHVKSQRISI